LGGRKREQGKKEVRSEELLLPSTSPATSAQAAKKGEIGRKSEKKHLYRRGVVEHTTNLQGNQHLKTTASVPGGATFDQTEAG